jgi:glycosyltransferase EpsD
VKKKVLFVASIDKHISRFHIPSLKWYSERGFEVHVACNGYAELPYCDKVHQIDFVRSPYSIKHFRVINQLKKLLADEKFYLVHCHTTVASLLTRIAGISFRKRDGLKVLHTSHGFHFFKGGPLLNWMVFYPIEKMASRLQDCLITINTEDFNLAKEHFYCKDVRLIPGMGVNKDRFKILGTEEKLRERELWDIEHDAKVIIYVAEFIDRKNHRFIIESAKELKSQFPELIIILPGRGKLLAEMKKLAEKLDVISFVRFPGFINNVESLMASANLGVSSSKQEGLGLHIVEAMMSGLPVIATDNSGHRELIQHGINGFLYELNDKKAFEQFVSQIFSNPVLYTSMSHASLAQALRFEMELSNAKLDEIYTDYTRD